MEQIKLSQPIIMVAIISCQNPWLVSIRLVKSFIILDINNNFVTFEKGD